MHSNLRILYVLIFITAVTGGVWLYTQPAGQLASIEGTDFAVEDTSNTLGNVMNSLQTGGCVYLMKGPKVDPEIKAAGKVWGEYYQLEKDKPYTLPSTSYKRRLLVYRKIKNKSDEKVNED